MPGPGNERVVIGLPDMPELAHMGEFPANVEVLLYPTDAAAAPIPELAGVDLIVPLGSVRGPLYELIAGPPGHHIHVGTWRGRTCEPSTDSTRSSPAGAPRFE